MWGEHRRMQVVKRAKCWNIKRKLFINLLQCLLHMCEWNLSWWKYAPRIWKGRQKGRLPSFWTSCHHEKGAHEIENSSYMKKKNTERKFVFQLKHFNVLEIHSKPFTKKLKPWLWQWHSLFDFAIVFNKRKSARTAFLTHKMKSSALVAVFALWTIYWFIVCVTTEMAYFCYFINFLIWKKLRLTLFLNRLSCKNSSF